MNDKLNLQQQEIQLEKMAVQVGLEQFHKQTEKLEKGQYASATAYGACTINSLLPAISEMIEGQRMKVRSRRNGQDFALIGALLDTISSDQLALIGLKIMIDRCCDTSDDDAAMLANVYYAVGTAVERQIQLDWYEQNHKEVYDYVTRKYWNSTTGTEQKFSVMRLMMNRREIQWDNWPRPSLSKVGNWVVRCVCDVTGWFQIVMKHRLKKKVNFLEPSEIFYLHKAEVLKVAELFTPASWPMVSEPNDWTSTSKGGYYLNELTRCHELVRRGDPEVLYQGSTPLKFLNNLQKVRYCINPFISEVAEWAWDKGIKIGKFLPPTFEVTMPVKPPSFDSEEMEMQYKRSSAEAYSAQRDVLKKCVRTRKEMEVKRTFERLTVDYFFCAHSFDYRGRVYPLNAFLSPQNTDFGKSLIRFKDEAPMNDVAVKWIRRHLATTWGNGVDKQPWNERELWVATNHNQLVAVATDPYSTVSYWQKADEPWQFLAACEEWYHTCVLKDRTTTGLPCGIDQSCSGIQYWSGAVKDKNAAKYVNVLPGTEPQDAYKAVAIKALEWTGKLGDQVFPKHIAPYMTRSVTKRVVMTLPYNAKADSNKKYINAALKDVVSDLKAQGIELVITPQDRKDVKDAVVWAMDVVFPNIMAAMKIVEKWAGQAIRNGALKLVWVSPSGFIVSQRKEKFDIIEIKTQLLGKTVKTSLPGESLGPNEAKHKNCTSPNWIHSLDAATLHICFAEYDKPFSLIHDCCLAPATYLDEISENMRQAYITVFTEHDPLDDLRKALGASPDETPTIGELDVREVLESPYYMA